MRNKDIPTPAEGPEGPRYPESGAKARKRRACPERTDGDENAEPPVLASTKQVSRRYGIPERTLEHKRYMGNGPPYVRVGARCVRYRLSDVERWLNERTIETTDA